MIDLNIGHCFVEDVMESVFSLLFLFNKLMLHVLHAIIKLNY